MKRQISAIISVILLISLCGCGSKPVEISEQHYNYGMKALEIVDQYLDYKATADEAASALNELYKREDELPDTATKDDDHIRNEDVEHNVAMLYFNVSSAARSHSSSEYQDVLEYRNSLAEALGEKER